MNNEGKGKVGIILLLVLIIIIIVLVLILKFGFGLGTGNGSGTGDGNNGAQTKSGEMSNDLELEQVNEKNNNNSTTESVEDVSDVVIVKISVAGNDYIYDSDKLTIDELMSRLDKMDNYIVEIKYNGFDLNHQEDIPLKNNTSKLFHNFYMFSFNSALIPV